MYWTVAITALATLLLVVLAMNFATPEKKIERRIPYRHDVRDPQFLREMSVLLGPPILSGNRIELLCNGDEIFPAMLQAIEAAERTITFETYIYWAGDIGERFARALAERARAGVAVNVTIDWAGSIKMDDSLLDLMEDAGVEVHKYRPLKWYTLSRLNNRTHRKLLVVDGRVGFAGGVGVADMWLGHAQDPEHWRDIHFRIEGPVVGQLQAAFNDNWIKSTGCVLHGPDYFPPLEDAGGMEAHVFVASPSSGSESMHLMYLMALAAASRSIDIEASYFVPDSLAREALVDALGRGVRVRVLLPGPYIDSQTVRVATKREWGPLLKAGAEIHVYQPTMLHAKLLIIDGLMVSLGSTNFDMRSFRLNDETSLNVYDEAFAAELTSMYEEDLTRATLYTYDMWRSRPWTERLQEALLRPFKSQL